MALQRKHLLSAALLLAVVAACSTAPTGRRQFIVVGDGDMAKMGAAAFDEIKGKGKLANDPAAARYVGCVADALIAQLPEASRRQPWEVVLIAEDSANAFALPGGKVGVHTGLLKLATTQDELAAVIGHELAHVVSRHAAERVSQQFATEAALQVADSASGGEHQQLLGLLGAGAQAGVLLPFSRKHESEADELGQRYMAEAGFDPAAAVALWQAMAKANGGQRVPAWLSTHPDPAQRIAKLAKRAPALAPVYQQARAAGRIPKCR